MIRIHHPEKKHMPLPGFEPGSPRPQSKSDDLDRSAMGPARRYYFLDLLHVTGVAAGASSNIMVIHPPPPLQCSILTV